MNETFDLSLTKAELIHVRDLFGVSLPVDMTETVSQSLAVATKRIVAEQAVWDKVVEACKQAGIALADEAPNFVVGASAMPPMSVYVLVPEGEK